MKTEISNTAADGGPNSAQHPPSATQHAAREGAKSALMGIVVNVALTIVKAVAGILGNSTALLADAVESAADILSSSVVWFGIRMAGKPADDSHPYGHGKFEPLAAALVSLSLFSAAFLIAIESISQIRAPQHAPAAFTLIVLIVVIIIKEILFRIVYSVGTKVESVAVKADAWHHRSDVITSFAAFVGISIAIIGGPGYEIADDIAALIAALMISVNAALLLKPALFELVDTAPDPEIAHKVRTIAQSVPGVFGTHKCHVRKLGFDYYVDLDVLCDPDSTIRAGHDVAHDVGEAIHRALPNITKVLVHVEPMDDYGRRSR